jgi:hypothetical protein
MITIQKSSILFGLGLFRLFLLKTTNYKYSIPEYGVHWNFFFTIFFVKVRRKRHLGEPILLVKIDRFRYFLNSINGPCSKMKIVLKKTVLYSIDKLEFSMTRPPVLPSSPFRDRLYIQVH